MQKPPNINANHVLIEHRKENMSVFFRSPLDDLVHFLDSKQVLFFHPVKTNLLRVAEIKWNLPIVGVNFLYFLRKGKQLSDLLQ